jgi:hypothetical protein
MIRLSAIFREPKPMDRSRQKTDRFLLWVDAVGGYWVCMRDVVTLGQPTLGSPADLPILGDLSKRHARIRRDAEGYLIEAIRDVRVDGRLVDGVALLTDGCTIQLGSAVRLGFRRPHALSATARIDFLSRHRTQPSVDAVLLMADTCVLGPKRHSHVVCRDWRDEVVLYRHDDELYCRCECPFEIDGSKHRSRARISADSSIVGDRFSLSLESVT